MSATFNVKKRDNGSDNLCFFLDGHITRDYVAAFGLPGDDVVRDLARRAAIVPADWWFNRALCNSLIALDWRVHEVLGYDRRTRDDGYWMRAALRRHARWMRDREVGSFVSRGLVADPMPFGTNLLMALESVENEAQYRDWLESLWPSYLATSTLLDEFDEAEHVDERRAVPESGASDADVNPQVLAALSVLAGEVRTAA